MPKNGVIILGTLGSVVSKYSEISPEYISRCYSLGKEFCWGLKRIVKRLIRKTKYIMSENDRNSYTFRITLKIRVTCFFIEDYSSIKYVIP